MTIKQNLIILIFLNIFSFILSKYQLINERGPENGKDYPGIQCGKKEPKKPQDCTKYGTDSGMLCCWVSGTKDSSIGECTLLSSIRAEEMKLMAIHCLQEGEKIIIIIGIVAINLFF